MLRHFGIAALVAALGMASIGCDETDYDDAYDEPTAPVIDDNVVDPGAGYNVDDDESKTIHPNDYIDEGATSGDATTPSAGDATSVYENTPADPDSPNALEDDTTPPNPAPANTGDDDPDAVSEVPATDDSNQGN